MARGFGKRYREIGVNRGVCTEGTEAIEVVSLVMGLGRYGRNCTYLSRYAVGSSTNRHSLLMLIIAVSPLKVGLSIPCEVVVKCLGLGFTFYGSLNLLF